MQLSFPAIARAAVRGDASRRGLTLGTGEPEEAADDFDDAEGDLAPTEKRDARWWRDFGADFDDEEPEPERGDFWPESDDT